MPVVTTAENPLTVLLVQRCPTRYRPYPDIAELLSEYGRIRTSGSAQACPVHEGQLLASYDFVPTPLGRLLVAFAGEEIVGLSFDGHARTPAVHGGKGGPAAAVRALGDQLGEYFSRTRTRFDLPLRFEGTPFQRAVWSALVEVPYGHTSTYSQLAERIQRPRAARAVGAANGQNPISIVVPCHRLIGATGALTGYGWGLDRKRSLLELEGALSAGSGGSRRPAPQPVRQARTGS
jgi:methylated-DNA-[protein]-cysteine S-methyltransferase